MEHNSKKQEQIIQEIIDMAWEEIGKGTKSKPIKEKEFKSAVAKKYAEKYGNADEEDEE
jgi:hypothetical protein